MRKIISTLLVLTLIASLFAGLAITASAATPTDDVKVVTVSFNGRNDNVMSTTKLDKDSFTVVVDGEETDDYTLIIGEIKDAKRVVTIIAAGVKKTLTLKVVTNAELDALIKELKNYFKIVTVLDAKGEVIAEKYSWKTPTVETAKEKAAAEAIIAKVLGNWDELSDYLKLGGEKALLSVLSAQVNKIEIAVLNYVVKTVKSFNKVVLDSKNIDAAKAAVADAEKYAKDIKDAYAKGNIKFDLAPKSYADFVSLLNEQKAKIASYTGKSGSKDNSSKGGVVGGQKTGVNETAILFSLLPLVMVAAGALSLRKRSK